MKGNIIYGKHRSRTLAERHARDLSRKFDAPFEIIARRRADGRYSTRGHFFTFEEQEPTEEKVEYVLHFDYGKKRRGNPIDVQVHLRGPNNADDKEVKTCYKEWWETGNLPRGWSVRAIAWQHPGGRRGSGEPNKVRDYLAFVLGTRAKRIT